MCLAPQKSLAMAHYKVADGKNGNKNCIMGGSDLQGSMVIDHFVVS